VLETACAGLAPVFLIILGMLIQRRSQDNAMIHTITPEMTPFCRLCDKNVALGFCKCRR
jgi:hypothetical protein